MRRTFGLRRDTGLSGSERQYLRYAFGKSQPSSANERLASAYSIGEVVSAVALTSLFVLGLAPGQTVGALMALLALTMIVLLRRIENHPIEVPRNAKEKRSNAFALADQ